MGVTSHRLELAAMTGLAGKSKTDASWSGILMSRMRSIMGGNPYIPTGLDRQSLIDSNRDRILSLLGASPKDWDSWRWQMANRISDVDLLQEVLNLSNDDIAHLRALPSITWSVTPHYLSLMTPDPMCPIRLQAIPSTHGVERALKELRSVMSATDDLYPIRINSQCTIKCQYCTFCRNGRGLSPANDESTESMLSRAIQVVDEKRVKNVLLTGGDPLLLSDDHIDHILAELRLRPHIEKIGIETRVLATLPQRLGPSLATILAGYEVTLYTQINSPLEISRELVSSSSILRLVGVPLKNRPIHLLGINDAKYVMKRLNDTLFTMGFIPVKNSRRRRPR